MGCGPSAEDKAKIDELSKDVATKRTEIDNLKLELDKSMAKAKEAEEDESQLAAANREKKELEARLEQLNREKEALEASIQALTAQSSDLQSQLDSASSNNSSLQQEIAAIRGQLDSESQAKATLEGELGEVRNQYSALESLVETLKREKEEAIGRLSHFAEKMGHAGGDDDHHGKHRDCLKMSDSARIGVTGLYYCGQRIKGENDICGPMTGTNCKDCQKLDINSRDLPKGFLLNGQGRICRRGRNETDWYCGAGVLQGVPGCDGYCGPTNGPNCPACQEMVNLAGGRYRKLVS